MSTSAPTSGVQPTSDEICESFMRIVSGTPGRTTPVLGSERMSERFSRSSTKYGPSVRAGVTVHSALVDPVDTAVPVEVDVPVEVPEVDEDEDEDEGDVGLWLPHPTKPTATTDPMNERTSRRLNGD